VFSLTPTYVAAAETTSHEEEADRMSETKPTTIAPAVRRLHQQIEQVLAGLSDARPPKPNALIPCS